MKLLILVATLFFSANCFTSDNCTYVSKKEGELVGGNCGTAFDDDSSVLPETIFNDLFFDKNGLSCVLTRGDISANAFYVNQQGKSKKVVFFDMGCDYFAAGMARAWEGGKMVFINKALDTVLNPGFEYLSPFYYDHAVVCNEPFQNIVDGEHTFLSGGKCGLIDKKGLLVIKAEYAIGDTEVFDRYVNFHNHCPQPPISSEDSAVCHAQRHINHLDITLDENKSFNWKTTNVAHSDEQWYVTFIINDDDKRTITLRTADAQWLSVVPTSEIKK